MPSFTRMAIKATFLKLLDKKPLHKITVKEIVEECGINRNSFYYHYRDIPALIEETALEEMDRIIAEYPTIDSIETGLRAAIDFAAENRRAILHIYQSVSRDIFEQYLWKVCDYIVESFAKNMLAEQPVDPLDRDILTQFYRCAGFGMVIDWLNSDMPDDVDERIHRLSELQKGMLEQTLAFCRRR